MRELNTGEARFVEEYLLDLNATQAMIRAGYAPKSAKVEGCKMLARQHVKDAVEISMSQRSVRTEVTQDRVIKELAKIAFSNIKNVSRWGASGVDMKESEEISDDESAAISEIAETTNEHGGSLKVKRFDKVRALELLGKHLGMFKDAAEEPPKNDQFVASIEMIAAAIKVARSGS